VVATASSLRLVTWQCSSYRVGDVVDTIIRTPEETTEALSSQMPLFGVPSNAVFFESPPRFSLAFQDAGIPLPWVEMSSRKRQLDELIVTFVYSRSGDGAIHAISSEAKYEDAKPGSEGFRVRYEWVEEEEVDLRSGSAVMFLAVSIASIVILLQTCSERGLARRNERIIRTIHRLMTLTASKSISRAVPASGTRDEDDSS
jgi:hypothetical protein